MRKRIFFGLAPIIVLIVGMGAYAILLFAKLGSQVDVVLRENYRSVVAGQQMKEAAERMDSALFFSLVGEEQRGSQLYADFLPKFEEGLQTEMNNITVPGEDRLAHTLQALHAEYSRKADGFWKTAEIPNRRKIYFDEMLPIFTSIKDSAQAIITLNQNNMLKADRDAREQSGRSTRYMVLASLLGIAVACFFVLVVFNLITLPVEFDASRRAKIILKQMGLVQAGAEANGVNKVLNAAALTYVAAFVAALGQLIYFFIQANRSR